MPGAPRSGLRQARRARDAEFFHGRALVGLGRELRITERCLKEDLQRSSDARFEDLQGHDIVRAFVRERRDKGIGRPLTGLTTRLPVGVLSHGHDHRGATWFDEEAGVVWLMAYRRHRSGKPDDFFPWVQDLDSREELFPTEVDYEQLGGEYAIAVTVEVADDLQSITIAFDLRTLRIPEHKLAILAAFAPDPEGWEEVGAMPNRALLNTEQAYQYTSGP